MVTAFFSSAYLGFTNFMNLMETGLGFYRLPWLPSMSTLSQTQSQRQVQPGPIPRAWCGGIKEYRKRHLHSAWAHQTHRARETWKGLRCRDGPRVNLACQLCHLVGEPTDHHPCFHPAGVARAPLEARGVH